MAKQPTLKSNPLLSKDRSFCHKQLQHNKEVQMKVRINSQCMGDRNCNKLCPEIFDYDEDQLIAIVKLDEIPEKYHDLVRQAAQECVPVAIDIEE
jgi:ferredoxin